MTDFVFLVSPQKIAMLGLIALGFVMFVVGLFVAAEWIMTILDWYSDRINDYHMEPSDDSDRH